MAGISSSCGFFQAIRSKLCGRKALKGRRRAQRCGPLFEVLEPRLLLSASATFATSALADYGLKPAALMMPLTAGTGGTQSSGSRASSQSASTSSGSYSTSLQLPANVEWDDTGISVAADNSITVGASGQVYVGDINAGMPSVSNYQTPSGTPSLSTSNLGGGTFAVPGLVPWSLVGRIGPSGTPFEVGSTATISVTSSGDLYLSVNDNNFGDNSGAWSVTVQVNQGSGTGGTQPTIIDPSVAPMTTSLNLTSGAQAYIYGEVAGGISSTDPLVNGSTKTVNDANGALTVGLAQTSEPNNSFSTSCQYYDISGVGVSGFTGERALYGQNVISDHGYISSGSYQAGVSFTITRPTLMVAVGLGSSQQSISFQGPFGLITDQATNGSELGEAAGIAHAYLNPGSYTMQETTTVQAASQNTAHMVDLLGVYLFTGGGSSNTPPINTNTGGTGGTIRITSGNGSFAGVSDSSDTVSVAAGASISGQVNLNLNNIEPGGDVTPLIYTPSWGNPQTSYQTIGYLPQQTATTSQTANVSLTAPTTPGTYHIIFAFEWEMNGGQVASATGWASGHPDNWGSSNNIALLSQSQIQQGQQNGWTSDNWLYSSGYAHQYVPLDAITVVVGGGAGVPQTSNNLIINPGFEQGMTGWSVSQGTAVYSAVPAPHSGLYAAQGVEINSGSLGRMYQNVTGELIPGDQYTISGWIRTQNVVGPPGEGVVIAVDYVGVGGWTPADGSVQEIGHVLGTTGWTYYSGTFTLPKMPSDAQALWFLTDFNDATGTAWFDDLSLIGPAAPQASPSVTSVITQPLAAGNNNWQFTIQGSELGTKNAFNGTTSDLQIIDQTNGLNLGGSGSFVTANITHWSNNEIDISGFYGLYGLGRNIIRPGDKVSVVVTDPQTGETSSPYTLTVGQAVTPPPTPVTSLPTGWTDQDIGLPVTAGYADSNGSGASTVFTVGGAGTGIGGTADQFNFAYQQTSGNQVFTAELTGDSTSTAQAGIMLRGDASANSPFASLTVENGNLAFRWRSSNAASTQQISLAVDSAPIWLQLSDEGGQITASYSSDGSNYKQFGTTETVILASQGYLAGLTVSSQDVTTLDIGAFAEVSLAPQIQPLPFVPPSGGIPEDFQLTATAIDESAVALTWQIPQSIVAEGTLTFKIERQLVESSNYAPANIDPITATEQVGQNGGIETWSYTDQNLQANTAYTYELVVTISPPLLVASRPVSGFTSTEALSQQGQQQIYYSSPTNATTTNSPLPVNWSSNGPGTANFDGTTWNLSDANSITPEFVYTSVSSASPFSVAATVAPVATGAEAGLQVVDGSTTVDFYVDGNGNLYYKATGDWWANYVTNVGTSSPIELGIVGVDNTLYLYYAQRSSWPSKPTETISLSNSFNSVGTVNIGLMLQAGSESNMGMFTNVASSGSPPFTCSLATSAALGLPVPISPAMPTNPLDAVLSAINGAISSLESSVFGSLTSLENFIVPQITGLIVAPTQTETLTVSGSVPVTGIAAGVDVSVGISGSITVFPPTGGSSYYGINASLMASIGLSAGLQIDLPSLSVTESDSSPVSSQPNETSVTFAASLDAAAGIGVAEIDWSAPLASVKLNTTTSGIGTLTFAGPASPTVSIEVGWTGLIGINGSVDLQAQSQLGLTYQESASAFRQAGGSSWLWPLPPIIV